MAKTKISEFSSTPANNTDIDSINIAEGCAPSGINDAIRELMAQLKDFQTGAQGDSFNGPIGTSTAAAGAFTTLSATGAITSTLATGTAPLVIASTTKVANLNVDLLDGADWASPAALGSTTPAAVSATTLSASSTVTLSGGTANGVAYLNGSNVLTTGSALTFDGSSLGMGNPTVYGTRSLNSYTGTTASAIGFSQQISGFANTFLGSNNSGSSVLGMATGTFGQSTSNSIPWTVSAYGSEQMRLTSTGLGIGTSSILSKLVVSNGSSKNFEVQPGATTYLLAYDRAASDYLNLDISGKLITFSTNNGAEKMRLDSSGNLGLGVTPSAWGSTWKAIQVGMGGSIFARTADQNRIGITANAFFDTAFKYIGTGQATFYDQDDGNHYWYNAPSGTAGNAITFTQAMTLDASGNLGLGITTLSADTRLTLRSSSASGKALACDNGSNSGFVIQFASALTSIGNDFNQPLAFLTNNTERARIDSSGRLLVGTTSSIGTTSVGKVQILGGETFITTNSEVGGFVGVNSNADNSVAIVADPDSLRSGSHIAFYVDGFSEKARIDSSGNLLVGQTSTGSGGLVNSNSAALTLSSNGSCWTMNHSATSAGSLFAQFGYSGTKIGSITVATSSTVAYNTSSDYRLKENIAPMTGALAKVALLKPCTYTWKIDGSNGQGFIAHELAEVCPEAVTGEKDAVNEDGTINPQGIDTSFLVATLTAAIQEQQAIINQLKARLDAANL